MNASLLAMQFFSGLALGAVLVMLALGLSIIFGILGVVNFAHGALFMVGAYAGLFFFDLTGSFWWALLLGPLSVAALGLGIERFLTATRRQNFLVPPRRNRSFPLVELA